MKFTNVNTVMQLAFGYMECTLLQLSMVPWHEILITMLLSIFISTR